MHATVSLRRIFARRYKTCIIRRPRGRHMVSRGRRVRRNGVHMSGVPALALGRRVRRLDRVQPEQMDDGAFRLHGHVVNNSHDSQHNNVTVPTTCRVYYYIRALRVHLQGEKQRMPAPNIQRRPVVFAARKFR